jgi:AcrR family transcriptional regulator
MTQDGSTREKILEAAIALIEECSVAQLTVRKIAGRAGVNLAAINYHFSTKKKLVDSLMAYMTRHVIGDLDEIISRRGLSAQQRLRRLFQYLIEGGARYPGAVKAHLYNSFVHNDYSNVFLKEFNAFLDRLAGMLERHLPPARRKRLALRLLEAISSILFLSMLPHAFQAFSGRSFTDARIRRAYLEHLLSGFF